MLPRLLSVLGSVGITFFIPSIARVRGGPSPQILGFTVALLLLLSGRSFRVCVTTPAT